MTTEGTIKMSEENTATVLDHGYIKLVEEPPSRSLDGFRVGAPSSGRVGPGPRGAGAVNAKRWLTRLARDVREKLGEDAGQQFTLARVTELLPRVCAELAARGETRHGAVVDALAEAIRPAVRPGFTTASRRRSRAEAERVQAETTKPRPMPEVLYVGRTRKGPGALP